MRLDTAHPTNRDGRRTKTWASFLAIQFTSHRRIHRLQNTKEHTFNELKQISIQQDTKNNGKCLGENICIMGESVSE